jgi:hypothetical protein
MIIISGCPRSGTSLMMDCMLKTFGEERILGKKFPQEEHLKYWNKKHEKESEEQFELRQYLQNKNPNDPLKEFEKSKDMNPNGFWEMLYTVQGCYYRLFDAERLKELLNEELKEAKICKIVSQGLAQTDPRYVHRIIYMIRHPRQVAKSQERLKRNLPQFKGDDGRMHKMDEELKIHTPEMYINVTSVACKWFLVNPEVPVYFVNFDELITKPEETLNDLQKWLGFGDFSNAINCIEPKLKRSDPENIEHRLWKIADDVYDLFNKKDYQGVIDRVEKGQELLQRENARWQCLRRNQTTTPDVCKQCRGDKSTTVRFREDAEKERIKWEGEPCLFECGMGFDIKHISVKESISDNFWQDRKFLKNQKEEELVSV